MDVKKFFALGSKKPNMDKFQETKLEYERELERARTENKRLADENADLESEVSKLRIAMQDLEFQSNFGETPRFQAGRTDTCVSQTLVASSSELQNSLQDSRALREEKAEIEHLKATIKKLEDEKQRSSIKTDKLGKKEQHLTAELADLRAKCAELQGRIEARKSEMSKIESERNSAEKEVKRLKNENAYLSRQVDELNLSLTCEVESNNHLKIQLKEKEQNIGNLQHQGSSLETQTTDLETKISHLQQSLRELQYEKEKDRNLLTEKANDWENRYRRINEDNKQLKEQIDAHRNTAETFRKQNAALEAWKKEHEQSTQRLQREIAELRAASREREQRHTTDMRNMQSQAHSFVRDMSDKFMHVQSGGANREFRARARASYRGGFEEGEPESGSTLTIVELPDSDEEESQEH